MREAFARALQEADTRGLPLRGTVGQVYRVLRRPPATKRRGRRR